MFHMGQALLQPPPGAGVADRGEEPGEEDPRAADHGEEPDMDDPFGFGFGLAQEDAQDGGGEHARVDGDVAPGSKEDAEQARAPKRQQPEVTVKVELPDIVVEANKRFKGKLQGSATFCIDLDED